MSELWATLNAEFAHDDGVRRWDDEVSWGLFRIPEDRLGVLGDVAGLNVVDVGCGTGYLSAQLARRGARPVGVDPSDEQLATARHCQAERGPTFPLVRADGEHLPLRAACADLVVSEYGAGPWCEPRRWLAEAARVLRPGGRLAFLTNSVLAAMCVPAEGGFAGDHLRRGQRELRRIRWPGGGVEHHPGHGEWIGLLRHAGFAVEALVELHADPGSTTPEYYDIVTADWARRWPAEDLWVARRDGSGTE